MIGFEGIGHFLEKIFLDLPFFQRYIGSDKDIYTDAGKNDTFSRGRGVGVQRRSLESATVIMISGDH